MEELFDIKTDDLEFKEVDLLILFIEQYENTYEEPYTGLIEIIKYRMEQKSMRNKGLDLKLGSNSKASEE